VKNLKNGEVEIVAEGSENDLQDFIKEINIVRRPIAVKSFNIRWEEATGDYAAFEIIRGDLQEEIFERIDYAGNVLQSMDTKLDQMLDKQDQMLDKQDQMLDKQDQTLQVARETKEEIAGLRSDTRKHLDDEFVEIRKDLVSIKEALARAGIQV